MGGGVWRSHTLLLTSGTSIHFQPPGETNPQGNLDSRIARLPSWAVKTKTAYRLRDNINYEEEYTKKELAGS